MRPGRDLEFGNEPGERVWMWQGTQFWNEASANSPQGYTWFISSPGPYIDHTYAVGIVVNSQALHHFHTCFFQAKSCEPTPQKLLTRQGLRVSANNKHLNDLGKCNLVPNSPNKKKLRGSQNPGGLHSSMCLWSLQQPGITDQNPHIKEGVGLPYHVNRFPATLW